GARPCWDFPSIGVDPARVREGELNYQTPSVPHRRGLRPPYLRDYRGGGLAQREGVTRPAHPHHEDGQHDPDQADDHHEFDEREARLAVSERSRFWAHGFSYGHALPIQHIDGEHAACRSP